MNYYLKRFGPADLITNGTFDSDVSGWTNDGTYPYDTFEWSAGKLHFVEAAGQGRLGIGFAVVKDTHYKVTFELAYTVNTLRHIYLRTGSLIGIVRITLVSDPAAGVHTYYFVATHTGTWWLSFERTDIVGVNGTLDNVELYEVGDLPLFDADQDIGPDPITPANIVLPGGGTFNVKGTDQALPSGHTIAVRGIYKTTSEALLQARIDDIRSWIGKRSRLWLVCADDTVRWRYARLLTAPLKHLAQGYGRFQQLMELTFELDDMLWYGEDATATVTVLGTPQTTDVENEGDQVVRDITITVTAVLGDIDELDIDNARTGHVSKITFSGTIAEDDSLVIDLGEMTVKNDGVDAWNDLDRASGHTINELLRLAPGDNALTIDVHRTVGAEMVTNGAFATDINGWTNDGTYPYDTYEWDGVGQLLYGSDGSGQARMGQGFSIVTGKLYRLTFDLTYTNGTKFTRLRLHAGSLIGTDRATLISDPAAGSHVIYFEGSHTETQWLNFHCSTGRAVLGKLDNVTLKEVTAGGGGSTVEFAFSDGYA